MTAPVKAAAEVAAISSAPTATSGSTGVGEYSLTCNESVPSLGPLNCRLSILAGADGHRFFSSASGQAAVSTRRLLARQGISELLLPPQSIALSQPESDSAEILELQTEPFPALGAPIEWTFGMWIDAARFVLELWSALLSRGVTIAMPTPEAVSFRHVSALFVHPCAIGSVTSEGFRLGARRF